MFIIDGENSTDVHEGQQADGHIEVAREGTGPVLKLVLVASIIIKASATRKRPRVIGNIAARSDGEAPLAQRICIMLMETVRTALNPGLGESGTRGNQG